MAWILAQRAGAPTSSRNTIIDYMVYYSRCCILDAVKPAARKVQHHPPAGAQAHFLAGHHPAAELLFGTAGILDQQMAIRPLRLLAIINSRRALYCAQDAGEHAGAEAALGADAVAQAIRVALQHWCAAIPAAVSVIACERQLITTLNQRFGDIARAGLARLAAQPACRRIGGQRHAAVHAEPKAQVLAHAPILARQRCKLTLGHGVAVNQDVVINSNERW
jgi:hypothetical protein